MKRIIATAVAMLLCAALLLTGCQSAGETADFPVSVEGVVLETQPQRIVSLSPVLSAALMELNGLDVLAGVSDYCHDKVPETGEIPAMGSAQTPDVQAIIDSGADTVLSVSAMSAGNISTLEAAGIRLIILPQPTSLAELAVLYTQVGTVLKGASTGAERGDNLSQNLTDRLSFLSGKIGEDNTASYLYLPDLSGAAATGDTLESEVLGKLGLQNTASELAGYALSDEQLAGMDPDWLICDDGITAEALAASRYASLPAVQEGRVLYVDGAPFELCSSRMADTALAVAEGLFGTELFTVSGAADPS